MIQPTTELLTSQTSSVAKAAGTTHLVHPTKLTTAAELVHSRSHAPHSTHATAASTYPTSHTTNTTGTSNTSARSSANAAAADDTREGRVNLIHLAVLDGDDLELKVFLHLDIHLRQNFKHPLHVDGVVTQHERLGARQGDDAIGVLGKGGDRWNRFFDGHMLQLDHMGHKLAGLGILVGGFVGESGTLLQRLSHRHRRDELLTLRDHGDAIQCQDRIPHLDLFVLGEGGLGIDADLDLRQSLSPKHRPLDQWSIHLIQEYIEFLILEHDRVTWLIGAATFTQSLDGGIVHRLVFLRGLTGRSRRLGRPGRRLARAR